MATMVRLFALVGLTLPGKMMLEPVRFSGNTIRRGERGPLPQRMSLAIFRASGQAREGAVGWASGSWPARAEFVRTLPKGAPAAGVARSAIDASRESRPGGRMRPVPTAVAA